ncbi:MAG: sugar ABC transporter ATP-binding protein [Opitutaceae bacterium]|nr:sugar ABC transporter ATP-binding protein [Opitutaceae bacterium]
MTSAPAVEFQGIDKNFSGVPVLRAVTFSVAAGRTLGLVGENGAGKSTLMNILGGNLRSDHGRMVLAGQPYAPGHPTDASRRGVAFIHQDLNLFSNLTIAENIFLTSFPRLGGAPWIAQRRLHTRTTQLLHDVGLDLAPDTPVERLSTGECQLVEIARALSVDARLIILDEPTTSLSARETDALFALLRRLQAQGIALIYISHILEHVRQLCHDVVVLRDGAVVAQGTIATFSTAALISAMVGRSLTQLYPTRHGAATGEMALEVKAVSQPGIVRAIDFTVRRGEVVGMFGLMGAGRSELARILFGLEPHASGEISIAGQPLAHADARRRIEHGLAFVSDDRRHDGLCLHASIADNLALVSLRSHARGKFKLIDRTGWQRAISRIREAVRLTAKANDDQPVQTLSGGNQQKVALGKWLLMSPAVLILDEPTRGVDVGAKFDLYQLMLDLADRGSGLLVISSEIEELIGICDRILVMSQGEIRGNFRRTEFNRETLLTAALPRETQT